MNIFWNFFFYLKEQSFRLIMENNFIQMAALAGHAVGHTIGTIFKHIIELYFTNGFTNIVLVGVTLISDGTRQIIVKRWQFAFPSRPNDISSVADNAICKNRAQNIECTFGCVARSEVLLKPNVANILLFNFCKQKFFQHCPITIVIDCNGNSLPIFEDKWPNYASGLKSAPNSDSFWVHRLFNVCVRVICAPNVIILLVYIPAKIKMSFIWIDNFFLPKSTFSVVDRRPT